MESIICPICYGKAGICVGVKDDLTPILMPCYGCFGRGWVIAQIDKRTECGFTSHGRGNDSSGNTKMS